MNLLIFLGYILQNWSLETPQLWTKADYNPPPNKEVTGEQIKRTTSVSDQKKNTVIQLDFWTPQRLLLKPQQTWRC